LKKSSFFIVILQKEFFFQISKGGTPLIFFKIIKFFKSNILVQIILRTKIDDEEKNMIEIELTKKKILKKFPHP
jgi:hypothetical protein